MDNVPRLIRSHPARQQPRWDDAAALRRVTDDLADRPAVVNAADVRVLCGQLAQVAAGEAHVIQAGDCAEDPAECSSGSIAAKTAVLDLLAGTMRMASRRPVLRVGRIAGQFAKPRSRDTEHVGGRELPVYRGHMVNGPEPDADRRRADPRRILMCYQAARDAVNSLDWYLPAERTRIDSPVWTSHEALLLDYELPLLRRDPSGRLVLTSTHWPWVGERTRQPDGAHVKLLSLVSNPVACKVGPGMTTDELLRLCAVLDPDRRRGRLTLIARMGADLAADRLPPLVAAVRAAGHPVIWLSDPMHGNTVTAADGLKTRFVETIQRELVAFQEAVRSAGGVAGGVHLETTPDEVTECVADVRAVDQVGDKYTTFCDPRLTPRQAVDVLSVWTG
ncbi:3-deoxy-7-phosphoheptulonate synthase [Streptomyces aureocirculatus]|uniref:3-deoxy-7-phosphoheptulonate synthase n=1 Tax=Streptomyces aureocirculatus TaxID=67275 RepID=UPI0004C4FBC5|nr:3-deoxy-7-phosphoheptulonate synthase [Streptomyces aureocirculatus]